jgi:hypothetical protein
MAWVFIEYGAHGYSNTTKASRLARARSPHGASRGGDPDRAVNRARPDRESGVHGAEAAPRHGVERNVPSDDNETSEVETLFGQGSSNAVAPQAPRAGCFAAATCAPRICRSMRRLAHRTPGGSDAGRAPNRIGRSLRQRRAAISSGSLPARTGGFTEAPRHRQKMRRRRSGRPGRLSPFVDPCRRSFAACHAGARTKGTCGSRRYPSSRVTSAPLRPSARRRRTTE